MKMILMGVLVAAGFAFATEQDAGSWTVNMDATGLVTSMTLANPKTSLGIESQIEIGIDYQGNPVRGTVKYKNGIERDLAFPQEGLYYWEEFKGIRALWNYHATMGKTASYDPQSGPIPMPLYGRFVRVVTKNSAEYFGKLVASATNPDWFALEVDGASVTMNRLALSEIQQIQ